MNMKRTVLYIFLLALSSMSVDVHSQVKRLSRAAIDSIMNPPMYGKGDTILLFEDNKKDIGAVYDSDSLQTVCFKFKNITDSSVTITKVTTTCGCLAAKVLHRVIEPGEAGEIIATFDPRGKGGTFDSNLFVYTDKSGNLPVSKLTVYANVLGSDEWDYLPYNMGKLRLKRKEISFSVAGPMGYYTERILCANSGVRPLRLMATILPSYAKFEVEPSMIGPGEEGDIIITIDASKLPQIAGDTISFGILVGGIEGLPSKRTIKGIIDLKKQ